jgi:hypothetical protein
VPVVTDAHEAAERLHQRQAAPARLVASWEPEAIAAVAYIDSWPPVSGVDQDVEVVIVAET